MSVLSALTNQLRGHERSAKYRVRVNINGMYAYTFSLSKPTIKVKLTVKGSKS